MSFIHDWKIPSDSIEPGAIPGFELSSGVRIPAVGFGTFGSDHVSPQEVAEATATAIEVGYRHFDCASVYGNEAQIGEVFQSAFSSGVVSREELWVTSKLWNDMHGDHDVLLSCAKTLKDLKLDYLDLYLVHWPFPNYHLPGCDVNYRSPDATGYVHERFMKTWRQMERLVQMGLVRHIGTSNMSKAKLRLLLNDAQIRPACNEMELHPHFQQPELFDYVLSEGIQPIGFSPLGSPKRPERDRTDTDTVDIEDPVLREIAQEYGVHPAEICILWAVTRGQVPIPFSASREHIRSNLRIASKPRLSEHQMERISRIDKGCRLIKGQVFLWKEGQSWEDLWDLDGRIVT